MPSSSPKRTGKTPPAEVKRRRRTSRIEKDEEPGDPAPQSQADSETETGTDLDIDKPSYDEEEEKSSTSELQPAAAPKKKAVITRTLTALSMIAAYLLLLVSGHLYVIASMVLTQTECYRELVNIRYTEAQERRMPWFRTLQWAWFFVPMINVYGETLHKFCVETRSLFWLTSVTQYISSTVFVSYCILFITSVGSLKKGLVKFQISQFMWSIVTVCLVVLQCKLYATNVLNGIFWFFFPMATVVMNDVSAYFCGITMGRKFIKAPFLALSPNKTWEGFIGASVGTVIFSFFFPALLAQFDWLVCPAEGLYLWPTFTMPALTCARNSVFVARVVALPLLGDTLLYPIQLHGIWFGLFASFVAPFGGFFASAIKRAYKKKDFDNFFPGHGGLMDRMDCQFFIIYFTIFYCTSFIYPKVLTVGYLLNKAQSLPPDQQQQLWQQLGALLGK